MSEHPPSAALLVVLLTGSRALADYPIASHRYLADPGSLVYDGRVYLYSSNDDDNAVEGGYTMHSIVCVSTGDLKNWTDHGVVFQVPADASWANYSWAPQPIARSGKIFLYFGNNASGVGVAASTNPTGEFKDAKGGYLVTSSTPGASGTSSWLFDPGVFIDEDGQAYLSFGGNGANNGRIIKLDSDLVSVSGSAAQIETTNLFEASFLFKRNGIYYFSYSTNPSNGQRIDYLTSSSPMSGYTYRGTIAGQPPSNSNNNQASQFEFNGKWYHAYHNRYVATQAGISTTYRRNLGLEVLNFNADGTIQQVTYTTDGVPQVGNLDPYVRVEAETMNAQSGIETETCGEGGVDVTQTSNGDWIRVRGVDFGNAGATSFSARVASTTSGGSIELRLGSATGQFVQLRLLAVQRPERWSRRSRQRRHGYRGSGEWRSGERRQGHGGHGGNGRNRERRQSEWRHTHRRHIRRDRRPSDGRCVGHAQRRKLDRRNRDLRRDHSNWRHGARSRDWRQRWKSRGPRLQLPDSAGRGWRARHAARSVRPLFAGDEAAART